MNYCFVLALDPQPTVRNGSMISGNKTNTTGGRLQRQASVPDIWMQPAIT